MSTARRASDGHLDSRPPAETEPPSLPAGDHRLDLGPGGEAVLVVPQAPPGPLPLLVFFHGAGGSAAHSVTLMSAAATAAGCLLLAPTSVASTWDLIAGGLGRDVAVLDAALDRTFASVPVSGVAVGGFSDGASYALAVGLANGDLFDAVLAFSPGFAAPPAHRGRPRVWMSHGRADRVLPVDRCGRRVSRDLSRVGYDVVYEEFDGGHVVPPHLMQAALRHWLT